MTLRHVRVVVPGIALLMLSAAAAYATTPVPFTVPAPEITALVPFATPPFAKPSVTLMDPAVPSISIELLPTAPALAVTAPLAPRPVAALGADAPAGCDSAAAGSASDLLACGRARLKNGAYDGAAQALQNAIRVAKDRDVIAKDRDVAAKDRDVLIRSRYWLGEALLRLGKIADADAAFRQAASERGGNEYDAWSAHAAGWTALRLDDPARARDMFTRVLAGTVPPAIDGWARHGLGLSLYAAGQHAEAAQAWGELSRRTIPAEIASDVAFWYGDALGRIGDYARAEQQLRTFVNGARAGTIREHPMLAAGIVRLGWWALAAGHPKESAATFKACFASACGRGPKAEQDLAGAGLALALGASGDWNYGRGAARWLGARKSPLVVPISLRMMRVALDAKNSAEALAMAQEVLAGPVTTSVRAWVLMMKGEVLRRGGDRDEARTQYDLAQRMDPGSDVGVYAAYRLAQGDFELREFAAAATGLDVLDHAKVAPDLRAGALLLQGEAAYRAGDHAVATQAFKRLLAEFPGDPQAPLAQLSLAWSAFRQGQPDEARGLFTAFAGARPNDAHTADALTLAAQMTLDAGDLETARQQLDHVIAKYPTRPGTDVARLNRAILMVRSGQHADAQTALQV
jgi:tetratricopeptide (TPR) repeat protein